MSEQVGFIGLGYMGHGMAKNIVDKGYALTVMSRRDSAAVADLLARGAHRAGDAAGVAAASTVIFLCVTGSPDVEALVSAMKPGLKRGSVIVDCSTSDPTSTLRLAADLAPLGVELVDAPLSRTPKEAWEGTLDTMVGASDATFARLKPIIDCWAGKVVHIGGTGDGHKMKLLNNFLSLGYAALYAEALALSAKVGITAPRFDNVIRGGRMDCGFYQTFMQWTLDANREAHKFTIANAFKDLRYLESMADAAGIANPMGNAVKNSFALAHAEAPEDFVPMLASHVARLNHADLTPGAK